VDRPAPDTRPDPHPAPRRALTNATPTADPSPTASKSPNTNPSARTVLQAVPSRQSAIATVPISAICRYGRLGAQLLCSLCVASAIYRRLPAGHSVHPARLPPPHRCAVARLARAWRRGGEFQNAPSCATACHPRLDTELAAPGATQGTMLRHGAVRLLACEPEGQQPGQAWLA